MNYCSNSCNNKHKRHELNHRLSPHKKQRKSTQNSAFFHIKPFSLPLISTITDLPCELIHLKPGKPCSIGRNYRCCEFIFADSKVSRIHCQIVYDSSKNEIYVSDGVGFSFSECTSRSRARAPKVSLNGIFVNGNKISGGSLELHAGDDVSFVCGNEEDCANGVRIGFSVEKIVLVEEILDRNVTKVCENSCLLYNGVDRLKCDKGIAKANSLLSMCRGILSSDNPVSYIQKCVFLNCQVGVNEKLPSSHLNFPVNASQYLESKDHKEASEVSRRNSELNCFNGSVQSIEQVNDREDLLHHENETIADDKTARESTGCMGQEQNADNKRRRFIPPPGKKFYLNRLLFMDEDLSNNHNIVSLPELFYPVESLERVFIATFTSDVRWFLSYCEIPADLPITIACHNAERCWSSSPDKRTSIPYSDFPNVVLTYPPFPEIIAFGKDRKKLGIACHHPKLFLLQRENSLRVIITSANLVAKQWLHVTNTVWWQDFPRSSSPNYFSLFTQLPDTDDVSENSESDFAAQLAGFVSTLVTDVPSQAYWILELTKFDFKEAVGYLVSSISGLYSRKAPYISDSRYSLGYHNVPKPVGAKFLGSVETSVVGLSHLFRTSADQDGSRLKKLAAFLRTCCENVHGMFEVVLKRDTNILADPNAVSVLVPNPKVFSMQDCVQLGFLPRNVAKWVALLSDDGLFAFSAYIYPKEVLTTALEGSNNKVVLILYVTQGPSFLSISEVMKTEHVSAISSLVASIQRCVGIWRLEEVLSLYKWPEHLETEFLFGASSIGAVNTQFLAAFSAASGKRSSKFTESEESDPDWGCWSASQELKNPSIRIIFPTIERVKNASSGLVASRRMLCFSQKTWERLKNVGILHDAVPYPNHRVGLPMHIKVGRRRFQSRKGEPSFGWVYSGSHNFSAAAWGRPLSSSIDRTNNSILGSRLHICNYEIGIIFVVHPSDSKNNMNLDDIILPFEVPAPKYTFRDKPATAQAMREAFGELSRREREVCESVVNDEEMIVEEDEVLENDVYVAAEKDDDKAYAETLWTHVEAS